MECIGLLNMSKYMGIIRQKAAAKRPEDEKSHENEEKPGSPGGARP